MVGNLLKNTESNGWGGGLDAPSPPSPPNLRDLGLWTVSGGPPAAGRGGEGVLSCETPGGATLCSINPLGGGVRCWSNLDPPHSCPCPRGIPQGRGTDLSPLTGAISVGWRVFFIHFYFLLIKEMFGPCPPPVSLVLAPPLCAAQHPSPSACPSILDEPQVLTLPPIMCLKLMVSDVNILC